VDVLLRPPRVSWTCGRRDADTGYEFRHGLASRLKNRVQLTTDGLHAYLVATDSAFGTDIDSARLTRVHGSDPKAERCYAFRSASAARRRLRPAHPTCR